MIEHLFHNDHGEWSLILAVLGGAGVTWTFLRTRALRAWWRLRGKQPPCVETGKCCEHGGVDGAE